MKYRVNIDGKPIDLEIFQNGSEILIRLNGKNLSIDIQRLSEFSFSVLIDGRSHFLSLLPTNGEYHIEVDHCTQKAKVLTDLDIVKEKFGIGVDDEEHKGEVHVQIPGLVLSIDVAAGDRVEKGAPLFTLSSMKMENEIKSPVGGVVEMVHIHEGENLEKGALAVTINDE